MMRQLLCLLLLPALCLGRPASEKPNIIVIYTDDHGWPDIGAQDIYPDLKTPNIDALAAGGVRATNGYSTAPQCVPSRAGLMTGRSQNRFGVESNGTPLGGFNQQLTIAERLKKVGYATGQIGKWHLGPGPEITTHGFDDVYYKNANRPGWANYDLDGNTVPGGPEHSKLYHLDACTEAARAFIKRHEDQPFFLYLAYRAPHVPLDAPPKYLSRFPGKMPERRRQALAMISAMDDGVGAITADLRKRGLDQNTLIFFIADNGAPLKIHKYDAPGGGPGWDGSYNEPMNGEKGMLTEGGIRVPFVVNWPGTIPAGQTYTHPIITLDVAATAVSLAGLAKDPILDGVNLIPHLTGKVASAPHDWLAWRWVSQSAIREGKWKLLRGGEREYFYDLEADVSEKHDLAGKHPEIAARLRAKLKAWSAELDPPGLAVNSMAETWNDYFDFYLDGKPAPPLPARSRVNPETEERVQGWVVRNGSLAVKNNALVVTSGKGKPPFLAQTGVKVAGPASLRMDLRTFRDGNVGVSWRLDGQKDFVTGQASTTAVVGGNGWHPCEVPIPAEGTVIHLRLHLPEGESAIRNVQLVDGEGQVNKAWRFKD